MSNSEDFKKFILKQISGDVAFDSKCHTFRISLRPISEPIRKAIYDEGHRYGFTDGNIDNLLIKVQDETELAYKPAEKTISFIEVSDLNPGERLRLVGSDKVGGKAELELIYLGQSKETRLHRFMVLDASRLILSAEDVVEVVRNEMLSVNYPVQFGVYRQGRRVPDDKLVYRTFKLDSMTKIMPSIVHEIIDNKKEFTFQEKSVRVLDQSPGNRLSFGTNAMSLLLHEFSDTFPIYADFDDKGIGCFSSNPDAEFVSSKTRNNLFNITKASEAAVCLKIETRKPGELFLDKSDMYLKLNKCAEISKCVILESKGRTPVTPVTDNAPQQQCDLEPMAQDLKEQMNSISSDELKTKVHQWVSQFHNQGISIIALERLLNFYSTSHEIRPINDGDFVDPDSGGEDLEKELIKCRDEKDNLKKENEKLQKELTKWKHCLIGLLVLLSVLVVVLVIMIYKLN